MVNERFLIYTFSFLLAFCSLFYEFVYAQILSVCLGGTKIQYLITISLFTSALGLGSLLQGHCVQKFSARRVFFIGELLLTLLGSLGPFFITWLLKTSPGEKEFSILELGISYFTIFFIGILSGLEIPSLFSLLPEKEGKILAFDYLGMLVASVAFPFFFLPYLGTAAGTLMVANINALALVWLGAHRLPSFLRSFLLLVIVGLFFVIWHEKGDLNSILSFLYLGEA